jgi:hypothetical protein
MASGDMMIIVVMMMMMSSVFAVLAGGALFLNKPEEGEECEPKNPDPFGYYVIDEDGECVLDYCSTGYSVSATGRACVKKEDDDGAGGSGSGGGGGSGSGSGSGSGAGAGGDDGFIGSGGGPGTLDEVFHLEGYTTAKTDAAAACSALGAQLATKAQVEAAQQSNADWCSTGWVSDQDAAVYPITYEIQSGCGNGTVGIKQWTPNNNLAGVNCYGVKPAKDGADARIRPFNAKKWSMYDNPTKPNEVYYLGGPTGGYEIAKTNAANECSNFGAVVATRAQVEAAQKNKADWCATGWVSDQDAAIYPITTTLIGGCGNGSAGIKQYTPPNNLAGVNCIGPKPDQDDPGANRIRKFNSEKWSKYD